MSRASRSLRWSLNTSFSDDLRTSRPGLLNGINFIPSPRSTNGCNTRATTPSSSSFALHNPSLPPLPSDSTRRPWRYSNRARTCTSFQSTPGTFFQSSTEACPPAKIQVSLPFKVLTQTAFHHLHWLRRSLQYQKVNKDSKLPRKCLCSEIHKVLQHSASVRPKG